MDTGQAAIGVWQAFATRDPERIRAVLTEDVEWIAPPDNATAVALGVPSHMIGAQAIADFIIRDFPRLYPHGLQIELISLTCQEDRAVFEQRQRARLANGRDFDLSYVFIFEMAGDRARRIREYMDTNAGNRLVFGDEHPRKML